MKTKFWVVLIFIVSLQSCAILSLVKSHEMIAGVEIVSVEDIENEEAIFKREIRGVIPAPFETDEEWIIAFRAINSKMKLPGINTRIKIFLEEDNWEIGTPYAIGRFEELKQASIKVDGRLLKIKTKP
ncbi:MAG: hypothetical protein K9M55_04035 [Candidatus Marinimicrobia bacterium]|nr:hypothetical protein [Candidatus Neomarinimicrobiota bacterium]MCF7921850.1 hypothetical protein [Candidatus Neomarinimicrobiota bacterium]